MTNAVKLVSFFKYLQDVCTYKYRILNNVTIFEHLPKTEKKKLIINFDIRFMHLFQYDIISISMEIYFDNIHRWNEAYEWPACTSITETISVLWRNLFKTMGYRHVI